MMIKLTRQVVRLTSWRWVDVGSGINNFWIIGFSIFQALVAVEQIVFPDNTLMAVEPYHAAQEYPSVIALQSHLTHFAGAESPFYMLVQVLSLGCSDHQRMIGHRGHAGVLIGATAFEFDFEHAALHIIADAGHVG
jgi:hypothetical protein